MKKIQMRHYVYLVLLLLIIGSYTGVLVLWRHQRQEIHTLDKQVTQLSDNQALSKVSGYRAVTISPTDKAVYMPQAKLKLADSTLNEDLVYNYTSPYTIPGGTKLFPANLSISTHDLAANAVSTTQQFDCTEVAYGDFGTPSYPVNPKWKSDGSTKLADGRTMTVYYAPSIPGCDMSWQLNKINAKALADSLKTAVSY